MAQGMNRVTLMGNLGADPELKYFEGNTKVLRLRLATTESWRDKEGVQQERTEWHSVTVFGNRGEALSRILKKGDRLLIEGNLRTKSYEKDGVRKYFTEVIAREVVFGGGGRRSSVEWGAQGEAAGEQPPPVAGGAANGAPPPLPETQDNIPF